MTHLGCFQESHSTIITRMGAIVQRRGRGSSDGLQRAVSRSLLAPLESFRITRASSLLSCNPRTPSRSLKLSPPKIITQPLLQGRSSHLTHPVDDLWFPTSLDRVKYSLRLLPSSARCCLQAETSTGLPARTKGNRSLVWLSRVASFSPPSVPSTTTLEPGSYLGNPKTPLPSCIQPVLAFRQHARTTAWLWVAACERVRSGSPGSGQ